MSDGSESVLIDARGMRCPWPVLRVARAARETPGDASIILLADDPKAEGEITALAQANGWALRSEGNEKERRFTILRGPFQ